MERTDLDILIVPGLGDSGPEHWQTHWQAQLSMARRVQQEDWETPERQRWVERMGVELRATSKPVLVIAHSLGIITTLLAQPSEQRNIAGALFVSPPDLSMVSLPPNLQRFGPYPTARLPFPSILVASRDDPYAAFDAMAALATQWGSRLVDIGNAGHINAASDHGAWPEGYALLEALVAAM